MFRDFSVCVLDRPPTEVIFSYICFERDEHAILWGRRYQI